MKRCSRHDGVHIHGCPGCIADQRDRALLAMRKFAELDRRLAVHEEYDEMMDRWTKTARRHRLEMIRIKALSAFRDGDVEAALKAMEVEDD
jgi:hypothetical protein